MENILFTDGTPLARSLRSDILNDLKGLKPSDWTATFVLNCCLVGVDPGYYNVKSMLESGYLRTTPLEPLRQFIPSDERYVALLDEWDNSDILSQLRFAKTHMVKLKRIYIASDFSTFVLWCPFERFPEGMDEAEMLQALAIKKGGSGQIARLGPDTIGLFTDFEARGNSYRFNDGKLYSDISRDEAIKQWCNEQPYNLGIAILDCRSKDQN